MSRFILNLHAVAADEGTSNIRTSQWRTVQFASIANGFAGDVRLDLREGFPRDEEDGVTVAQSRELIHNRIEVEE